MGFLKHHLIECPPIQVSIEVKRGAPRQRKFFTLPVLVHSDTFKKALQFLVDHNYTFESSENDMQEMLTEGPAFKKKQNKQENT